MSIIDSDGFKLVTYKKGKKESAFLRNKYGELLCLNSNFPASDNTKNIDRSKILRIQKDMEKSEFFSSFIETLHLVLHKWKLTSALKMFPECGSIMNVNNAFVGEKEEETVDIICYGLGSFSSSLNSQHQLAFLLSLKEFLNVKDISIYDPIFSEVEKDYLTEMGFDVITVNEIAKRSISRRTIFFMPHCDLPLYNNLLWANWSPRQLYEIIIIGNSFSSYNRLTLADIQRIGCYVDKANKFITEVKVPNSYAITNVFNDMAIHYFDGLSLSKFPASTWFQPREPDYSDYVDDDFLR